MARLGDALGALPAPLPVARREPAPQRLLVPLHGVGEELRDALGRSARPDVAVGSAADSVVQLLEAPVVQRVAPFRPGSFDRVLLDAAALQLKDEALGLHLAQQLPIGALGPLDYELITSASVRMAMTRRVACASCCGRPG